MLGNYHRLENSHKSFTFVLFESNIGDEIYNWPFMFHLLRVKLGKNIAQNFKLINA